MEECGNTVGCTGTQGALGAKRHRPLSGVSSMLLQGAMRESHAPARWCVAEERPGASPEACLALRERLPLTDRVGKVSQSSLPSSTSGERKDHGPSSWSAMVPEVTLSSPLSQGWGAAERGWGQETHATDRVRWASSRRNPGDSLVEVQSRGEGVRGQRLAQARGSRGASDGAEESAHGQAVHTGMRTPGAGPSPVERLEHRDPATAHAVHGAGRGGGDRRRNASGCCVLEKDRRC